MLCALALKWEAELSGVGKLVRFLLPGQLPLQLRLCLLALNQNIRSNMIMTELNVQKAKVSNLMPYSGNSRTHSDAQIDQIAASIEEFGWTNPVLVDGSNGIIAGHGRVMAAQRLGIEEVPVIVLDHLNDAQKRALVIADNKLALNAEWDAAQLKAELSAIADFDMFAIGFDSSELDSILGDVYTPVYTPSFADSTVSSNDVEKAGANMVSQIDGLMSDKARQATEVMCPYCAETFQYSGG